MFTKGIGGFWAKFQISNFQNGIYPRKNTFFQIGQKIRKVNICPEGAFCVGRLKKKGCVYVRPSDRVPCALATNQQILGKNLEIRGFSVNFDLNHQKLKTCVLGEWIRIEE